MLRFGLNHFTTAWVMTSYPFSGRRKKICIIWLSLNRLLVWIESPLGLISLIWPVQTPFSSANFNFALKGAQPPHQLAERRTMMHLYPWIISAVCSFLAESTKVFPSQEIPFSPSYGLVGETGNWFSDYFFESVWGFEIFSLFEQSPPIWYLILIINK